MVKKLSNIECLEYEFFGVKYCLSDRHMSLIVENCRNLVEIDLTQISETGRLLIDKDLASNVRQITADIKSFDLIKDLFTNVKDLRLIPTQIINSVYNFRPFHRLSQIQFKKLKKLSTHLIEKDFDLQETNGLIDFIERNQYLTHLSLRLKTTDKQLSDLIFVNISRLKHLKHFEVINYSNISGHQLAFGLDQFRVGCPQLKSLTLREVKMNSPSDIILFLSALKQMNRLKRLDLMIDNYTNEDIIEGLNKTLISLKHLTHLKLIFLDMKEINSHLISDFDLHLPQLQALFITPLLKITEESRPILSGLLRLESLYVTVDPYWRELIYREVSANCLKIKRLIIA